MPTLRISPNDATLDARSAPGLGGSQRHPPEAPCAKVAMCHASSAPHISRETQSLLRGRLRMAALLLAFGFGIFFIREIVVGHPGSDAGFWGVFIFAFHGLLTVMLLAIGGGLCHKCTYSITTLRIAELAIFGVPAIFFVFMQWLELR